MNQLRAVYEVGMFVYEGVHMCEQTTLPHSPVVILKHNHTKIYLIFAMKSTRIKGIPFQKTFGITPHSSQ